MDVIFMGNYYLDPKPKKYDIPYQLSCYQLINKKITNFNDVSCVFYSLQVLSLAKFTIKSRSFSFYRTDIVLLVPLMFLWGGISLQQFELVPFHCTVHSLLLQMNLSHVLVLLSSKNPSSNQFILSGNKSETLSTYTEREKNSDLKSNSDTVIILSDSEDVITSDTVTCCGIKLSHLDIASLYPLHWLNDQV